VLFRHAGSRILFEEASSDRPSEETAEGAERTVARGGSVLREQRALDVLGRNVIQELLAEHRELARGREADGGVIADAIATSDDPLTLPSPPKRERVC